MTNIKKNCDIQSKALLSRPLVLHICCLRNRHTICARCKKFKASFDFSLACSPYLLLRNRYTVCARCKKFKASFDFSLAC